MPNDALRLHPIVKDIVFAHIPKTAGTSLRNMLVAALPDTVKVFDYGINTNQIKGDFIDAYTRGVSTPEEVAALRGNFGRNQRLLVCGHFGVRKYLGAFHPASFITFLRHPVDRIVSAYKHHVRHMSYEASFTDFYQLPAQINHQSRLLWGIDLRKIGFIGLTEAMPDMVRALSRHLDVDFVSRTDNVSSGWEAPDVDDKIRDHILALNEDDLQLYRHVQSSLDYYTNYRNRKDMGPVLAKGNVTQRGDGVFQGRATAFNAGLLAEIEVRVGTEVVHRCYADQFLPAKQAKAQAPHGVGGFSVQLPAHLLAGQKQVRFVIAGTEKDLTGSPIAL